MAKVFGIHLIRLREGVNEEELEEFVATGLSDPAWQLLTELTGWKLLLLKGDRGDRAGRYAWMWEIESAEALHRHSPTPETQSDESKRLWDAHPEAARVWVDFLAELGAYSASTLGENTIFTDYVVVAG